MKKIKLTKGYVALVDDKDYARLNKYVWYANEEYKGAKVIRVDAARRIYHKKTQTQTEQRMHRFILGITNPKIEVDHKNHKPLDNRRKNLRRATRTQNRQHSRKQVNNTSGFKGVSWYKSRNQWIACIMYNKVYKFLGYFLDKIEAAMAYDKAAMKYHGEFAMTNFGGK